MKRFLVILTVIMVLSCKEEMKQQENIQNFVSKKKDFKLPNDKELKLLDTPLPEIKSGDWLSQHDEKGQNFNDYYKNKKLVAPSKKRNVIYIQPIGSFTTMEKKIIDWNTTYIALFFGLKTIQLPTISEKKIPKNKKEHIMGYSSCMRDI